MELPKRKSTRLKNYNYNATGAYFVTICTKNRKNILCNIVGEGSPLPQLTSQGIITNKYILSVNQKYPTVFIDKYVIMPNHIHIILRIDNNGRGNPSPTVSNVIGWLKYNISKDINEFQNTQGKSVFQRSYHDHIIRGENDYREIWQYIDTNPQKWNTDCFYIE